MPLVMREDGTVVDPITGEPVDFTRFLTFSRPEIRIEATPLTEMEQVQRLARPYATPPPPQFRLPQSVIEQARAYALIRESIGGDVVTSVGVITSAPEPQTETGFRGQTMYVSYDLPNPEPTYRTCADCCHQRVDSLMEVRDSVHGWKVFLCTDCLPRWVVCPECQRWDREDHCRCDPNDYAREMCRNCWSQHWFVCLECSHIFEVSEASAPGRRVCVECARQEQMGRSFCPVRTDFALPTKQGIVEAEQIIPIQMGSGFLSEQGQSWVLSELYDMLTAQHADDPRYYYDAAGRRHWLIDEIVWTLQHPRGSLTKRIAAWYKQHKSYALTKSDRDRLGDVIAKNVQRGKGDESLLFTRDLNRSKHFFQNEDSCFWSCHAFSRCFLKQAGGFAMLSVDANRSYRDPYGKTYPYTPLSRCWVLPLDEEDYPTPDLTTERFLVFNAYQEDLIYFVQLLAALTGLQYESVRIETESMYVNQNKAFLLAARTSDTPNPVFDITWQRECDCASK